MKRITIVGIALILVMSLILVGCSSSEPAPSTPPSTSDPGTSPAHEEVEIQVYSAKFGGVNYVAGVTIAELLNKYHPWIKATNLETTGTIENIKQDDGDPAKKAITLRANVSIPYWLAVDGTEPLYDKAYNIMPIASFSVNLGGLFVTADPSIKTPQDLKGKKVGVGGKGSAFLAETQFVLKDCWDIWDEIQPEYLDFNSSRDAFMDGLLDVVYSPGQWVGGNSFVVHPLMQEVLQTREVGILTPTIAEIQKGKAASGWSIGSMTVPKDAFKENVPAADVTIVPGSLFFSAYPEMDEEVVYEITRIMYEHTDAFVEAHKSMGAISPEIMAFLPAADESQVHPGALKFYKEKGIKVSVGGEAPFK